MAALNVVFGTQEAPLLTSYGAPGSLIHPPEKAFDADVRFHGESAIWERLKNLTGTVVWDRIRGTVFQPFIDYIERGDWAYKGRLLSWMYFQMVVPDRTDELHFKINEKRIKFGRREFALTMGLRHGDLNVQVNNMSLCFEETCMLHKWRTAITLEKIEKAIPTANDEAKFRMGLVYLIYGIMMGQDPRKLIPTHVFYIVEDINVLNAYPWGEYMFSNLMGSWCKMAKDWLLRGVKERERPTMSGCIYAIQLWVFLVMPNVEARGRFVEPREGQGNAFPVYLRWRHTTGGVYSKTLSGEKFGASVNIRDDVVADEAARLYVISLGVPEHQVREGPRVLPSPPAIILSNVVSEEGGAGPSRGRESRPEVDAEDIPPTQVRRVGSRASVVGEDGISVVSIVPPAEILRIVQPHLKKVEDENRAMKAEIVELKSEVAIWKGKAISTSTEMSQLKDVLGDALSQLDILKKKVESLETVTNTSGHGGEDGNDNDDFDDDEGDEDVNINQVMDTPERNQGGPSTVSDMQGTRVISPVPFQLESGGTESRNASHNEPGIYDDLGALGTDFDFVDVEPREESVGRVVGGRLGSLIMGDESIYASDVIPRRGGRRGVSRGGTSHVTRPRTRGSTRPRGRGERHHHLRSVLRRPQYWLSGSWQLATPEITREPFKYVRRMDDEEMRPLNVWLKGRQAPTISLLNGCWTTDGNCFDYPADRPFFEMLLFDSTGLTDHHLDAYVGLLNARILAQPDFYDRHVYLCYSQFTSLLLTDLESWDGTMEVDATPMISLQTSAWRSRTHAYSIWTVTPEHWILVVMDIEHWTLNVYDSRRDTGDQAKIQGILLKWSRYMRIVLKTSPDAIQHQQMIHPDASPFRIVHVDCPQASEGKYSGLFALKFMDYLILRDEADIHIVTQTTIHMLRKKMAIDLFTRNLSPY